MKKWILRFSFVAAFTAIYLSAVHSVQAWQLPVEIAVSSESGDKTYIRMVVGLEKGATEGFDNLWDAPALASHPDPERAVLLNAYIQGSAGTGESNRLWKDIRGVEKKDSTEWIIKIDPVPAGKTVSVRWNVPEGMLSAEEHLVLKDISNTDKDGRPAETNVLAKPAYEFTSDGDGGKSLSMVYSRESSGGSSDWNSFGCGTVKDRRDDSPNRGAVDIMAFILIISPFILRFRNRLSGVFQG